MDPCTMVSSRYMNSNFNVNQLLFSTPLFSDLPELNWFTATNFRDQANCFLLELYGKYWFEARNIRDTEAPANLAKIS